MKKPPFRDGVLILLRICKPNSVLRKPCGPRMKEYLSRPDIAKGLERHSRTACAGRARPCTEVRILPLHPPCFHGGSSARLAPRGCRFLSSAASLFASLFRPCGLDRQALPATLLPRLPAAGVRTFLTFPCGKAHSFDAERYYDVIFCEYWQFPSAAQPAYKKRPRRAADWQLHLRCSCASIAAMAEKA